MEARAPLSSSRGRSSIGVWCAGLLYGIFPPLLALSMAGTSASRAAQAFILPAGLLAGIPILYARGRALQGLIALVCVADLGLAWAVGRLASENRGATSVASQEIREHVARERWTEALNAYEAAKETLSPEAACDVATSCLRLSKPDQAEGVLRKTLASAPTHADLRYMLGVVLSKTERDVEAVKEFERVARLHPALPDPWLALAALAERRGDAAAVLHHLGEAKRRLAPGDPRRAEIEQKAADFAARTRRSP